MGWAVLGRDFSLVVGLVRLGPPQQKYKKISKDYVNAFKARLDKIWLHQAVKSVTCIGLGPVGSKFFHL